MFLVSSIFLNRYPPDLSFFVEFLYIVDFNEKVIYSKEFLIFSVFLLSYPPFSLRQFKLTPGVRGVGFS